MSTIAYVMASTFLSTSLDDDCITEHYACDVVEALLSAAVCTVSASCSLAAGLSLHCFRDGMKPQEPAGECRVL